MLWEIKMSFKKYPDIERLGHEDNQDILMFGDDNIVIEEKVDGGNGSFWIDKDEQIHFGSRNRDLTTDGDQKAFALQQIKLREHLSELESQGIKINPDYLYYMEWMQRHTINYTAVPYVIGFDIRMRHNVEGTGYGLFLAREAREQEFNRIGIENVPLVWSGKVSDLKKMNIIELIPRSKYYEGMAEGIVIKNQSRKHPRENHQIYAKIVREEFKEDNRAVFGNIRGGTSDTTKVVEEFCTEARIRKAILKFVNEDNIPLDMKLMQVVPSYVIKDIVKEEFGEIFSKYKFLDFKEMKQRVPKKCISIIQQMMIDRSKSI